MVGVAVKPVPAVRDIAPELVPIGLPLTVDPAGKFTAASIAEILASPNLMVLPDKCKSLHLYAGDPKS